MEWQTVVLILGILSIVAVFLGGGKTTISNKGIEYDSKGYLDWILKAQKQKGLKPTQESKSILSDSKLIQTIPKARLLWIDDYPLNNIFEKQAFASLGIFCDSYTNNIDAMKALAVGKYDVIVSDISRDVEEESGWELLKLIQQNKYKIPFYFYTGSVSGDLIEKSKAKGADGITSNPQDLIKLVLKSI